MRKVVTEAGKKETEEVQIAVKYASLLYYILKPPSFLTQEFKYNNKSHDKILKYM